MVGKRGFKDNSLVVALSCVVVIAAAFLTILQVTSRNQQSVQHLEKNVLYITRVGQNIYMQYNGEVFAPATSYQGPPTKVMTVIPSRLYWSEIWIVPEELKAAFNELFVFYLFPSGKKLIYIMRYEGADSNGMTVQELPVSVYDLKSKTSTQLFSLNRRSGDDYIYPRLNSISPDEKYLNFDLYGCWNCGGHQPQTLLYNLEANSRKNIGKVSSFKWLLGGKYQYTDYITIPCAEQGWPGECSRKPSELPIKIGQI